MTKALRHDAAFRKNACVAHQPNWPGSCKQHGLPSPQTGQSSVEYAVVCAALAFALGIGMMDEHSVLQGLLDAYRTAYAKVSFSMSLPQ